MATCYSSCRRQALPEPEKAEDIEVCSGQKPQLVQNGDGGTVAGGKMSPAVRITGSGIGRGNGDGNRDGTEGLGWPEPTGEGGLLEAREEAWVQSSATKQRGTLQSPGCLRRGEAPVARPSPKTRECTR